MIIDRLTHSGVIDPGQLYEPPFTAIHFEGVEGAFGHAEADAIVHIISGINERAAA
jgi:type I restriction enzyme R subunit